jgi:hypothetical protein
MFSFYFLGFKKILGFLKKAFLVIVVYFIIIAFFLHFLNKDKPKATFDPVEKNRQEIYKVINDPKLKNTQEGKITIALYRGMLCGLIGEACTDNPKDGEKNFNHSLFGFMTNLIVLPYANPPASGVYWAYSGLQNAGFVPKTYAAEGIGFAAIKPFMSIWKVFRDISYMLLVLVLIAIGFMIMFRAKLNPQTVISVENSLPKIVVALLLITFSFPIAGFLIDLMYVMILLVISVFSPYIFKTDNFFSPFFSPVDKKELVSQYLSPSFLDIFPPGFSIFTLGGVGMALFNILPEGLRLILTPLTQFLAGVFSMWFITNVLGTKDGNPATSIADALSNIQAATFSGGKIPKLIGLFLDAFLFFGLAIAGVPFLLGLIVIFTIIFLIFRIFFILLKTYLEILLLIIFAPILLIFEAIPGKSIFSFWFKNLFTDLLSFVIVVVLILLSGIINHIFSSNTNQIPWTPPFIYGLDGKSVGALVGMGIFLLIPDFLKMVKELLGAKGLPISIGPGLFFGGVGAAYGGGMGALQQVSSLIQIPGVGGLLYRSGAGRWLARQLIPPTMSDVMQQAIIAQAELQKPGSAAEAQKAWAAGQQAVEKSRSGG